MPPEGSLSILIIVFYSILGVAMSVSVSNLSILIIVFKTPHIFKSAIDKPYSFNSYYCILDFECLSKKTGKKYVAFNSYYCIHIFHIF